MAYWIWVLAGLVLGSFLLSALLTPICRKIALHFRIMDDPGYRKIHVNPKPYLGGAAIFSSMTLIIGIGVYTALFILPHRSDIPIEVSKYLPNITKVSLKLLGLILGGTLMFLLGLIDDIKKLAPGIKFASQFIITILAVSMGIRLDLFIGQHWLSGLITVFWIIGITNAFNFMDNMDGLSSGVAAIATFIFLWYSVLTGHIYMAVILAVFLGSILGFIPYNFPPSSIFMGDAGALFIGFELGALTVLNSYYYSGVPTYLPVLLPLFVLSVPVFDMITVVAIRLKNHKPIYIGDKNHFSHRLLALGLSQRQALLLIYFITFATGSGALVLHRLSLSESFLILAQMIAIFAIIAILETVGRNRSDNSSQ